MRQYAILQNVARGINFGVVVKSNGNLKYFGWSEKAIEWSEWANNNNASLSRLPYGVSVGEFKGLSDDLMKKIITSSDEVKTLNFETVNAKTYQFESGQERYSSLSKLPSVIDGFIPGISENKVAAVAFKAQYFRKEAAMGEISLKMRLNKIAFNNETKQFNGKPNRASSLSERHQIQTKMSRGAERQFGKKITTEVNKKILDGSGALLIKREIIGSTTKEIVEVYVRARLGRAAIGAARAITPNRGKGSRLRGSVSRVISGVLDPRKRRDVDGDGMIFDGTWREMPDPTRNVPRAEADSQGRLMEGTPGLRSRPRSVQRGESNASRTINELRGTRRGLASGSRPGRAAPLMKVYAKDSRLAIAAHFSPSDSTFHLYTRDGNRLDFVVPYDTVRTEAAPGKDIDGFIRKLMAGEVGKKISERKITQERYSELAEEYREDYDQDPFDFTSRGRTLSSGRRNRLASGRNPKSDEADEQYDFGDVLSKLQKNLRMSKDEMDFLKETSDNILNNPNTSEDVRDAIFDLQGEIKKWNGEGNALASGRRRGRKLTEEDPLEIEGPRLSDRQANKILNAARKMSEEDSDSAANMSRTIPKRQYNALLRALKKEQRKQLQAQTLSSGRDGSNKPPLNPTELWSKWMRGGVLGDNELKNLVRIFDDILEDTDTDDAEKTEIRTFRDEIASDLEVPKRKFEITQQALYSGRRPIKDVVSEINRSYDSMMAGGDDFDTGLRNIAESAGMDLSPGSKAARAFEKMVSRLIKIAAADGPANREELPGEEGAFGEALASRAFSKVDGVTRQQISKLAEAVNAFVDASDKSKAAAAAARRTGLRSGRAAPSNQSTRRSIATTQRAASPRGLSSGRSGKRTTQQEIMSAVGGGPGGTINHAGMVKHLGRTLLDGDGKFWDSLTPEQKEAVTKAIIERRKALEKSLKGGTFARFWRGQTRGAQKQTARAVRKQVRGTGGRFDPRSEEAELTSADIKELVRILDKAVAKPDDASGSVQKFVLDDDGNPVVDADGNVEIKDSSDKKTGKTATNYTKTRRALDDLQTILNMVEDEDFSSLEHLHPTTKKALSKAAKTAGATVPKGFSDSESSIAKHAGGESKFKPRIAVDDEVELGKAKKDKTALTLASRLLRMTPERRAKIRAREQRRIEKGRRTGYVGDPTLEIKKRKLRARAMKRNFLSRFRKDRDPDELSKALNKQKGELTPVKVDNKGTVSVDDQFLTTMQFMDKRLQEAQELEKKEKKKVYDQLLATLWVNLGYSEPPTLITEDEARALVKAGWLPIVRGTGHEQVESESYVEQFLTSPDRFVPGQGMRAFGVGEYFSFAGGWDGYSGNPDVDRHSMLVLVPPSSDIVKVSELRRERDKMKDMTQRANAGLRAAFGNTREGVAAREPGEIAEELRKSIPNLSGETSRSGQIINNLVDRLDALENMPRTTDEQRVKVNDEKRKILDTIDYLDRFTEKAKGTELGYFAPIIGVDGIDTNDVDNPNSKSPFLLHNRSGVVAVQRPMTLNDAKELAKDDGQFVGRNWLKWARRADRSREGAAVKESADPTKRVKPKRTVRGRNKAPDADGAADEAAAPTPDSPSADNSTAKTAAGPQVIDSWNRRRAGMGGSNPANIYTSPDGTQYYGKITKGGENPATAQKRLETEVLAARLYKLAGIPTVDSEMATENGEPVMISKLIPNIRPADDRDSGNAQQGFVVDAWLANWDVMLNGNVQMDGNGNAIRTDVGGALDHRAQGALKGSGGSTGFGPEVGELRSMAHDRGDYKLSNISPAEIKRQAQKLSKLTDDDIRDTVMAVVKDPKRAAEMADILIKRRDNIVKNYG